MKLIIAGSRTFNLTVAFVDDVLHNLGLRDKITEIVEGDCLTGADRAAKWWAWDTATKLKTFTPDWDGKGRAAGPIRNEQMAEYGDAVLLIWDGESRGTANMKQHMVNRSKPIYEVVIKKA